MKTEPNPMLPIHIVTYYCFVASYTSSPSLRNLAVHIIGCLKSGCHVRSSSS